MTKSRAFLGALISAAMLLVTGPAANAQQNYTVTGSVSASEDACLIAISAIFLGGVDCTWNNSDPTGLGSAGWSGPIFAAAYYPVGQSPFDLGTGNCSGINCPQAGDSKADVALVGSTLVINDQGTPCDGDDTIAGAFSLDAATRATTGGASGRQEETWGSGGVTWTIAEHTVDSAASNGAGCDYVVGSMGFPDPLLQQIGGGEYPTESDANDAGCCWTAPGTIPIGSWNPGGDGTGNIGTSITVTVDGSWSCTEVGTDGTQCATGANYVGSRAVLENVLMKISTDANGDITSGLMMPNNEGQTLNTPPLTTNTWDGPLVTFTATCDSGCGGGPATPTANDLTADVLTGGTVDIAINVANFTDPVVVTTAGESLGSSVVVGSPGNAANIIIQYTAGGAAGTDNFTYTVSEQATPANTDDGNVTVNIAADVSPVAPDITSTAAEADVRGAAASAISVVTDVVAEGADLGNGGTVTTSNATGGSATVSGTMITFVPSSNLPGTAGSYDYTITEPASGGGETATGTVSVEIPDVSPSITTATLNADVGEGETSVTVDVLSAIQAGNGTPDEHTFAVTTQPENGEAAFGSPQVTYTPNADFVSAGGGTDCFNYNVEDVDGSTSGDGEVCVTVAGSTSGGGSGIPGGSSAIDLWSLALLLGLPLVRRRRRH